MARFARVVFAHCPYHITHRGNRRGDIFFRPEDRAVYRQWLFDYAAQFGLEIWAYCLMTNHIHLVAHGRTPTALADTIGRAHMRYARYVNRRQGWTGHLWANRFYSTPLDEPHLWAAVKYVELNPVRAGLCVAPGDYEWSSARSHIGGLPDPLLSPSRPLPGRIADWGAWLAEGLDDETLDRLRKNTRTGRPTGSARFVEGLETALGRLLSPAKRGRKPRESRGGAGIK